MRRHFPLTFPSEAAAEAYLATVQREQPDAKLVRLQRRSEGWAACLSTSKPLGDFRGLAVREGRTRGRCVCSR
jgi:hypothetical protein